MANPTQITYQKTVGSSVFVGMVQMDDGSSVKVSEYNGVVDLTTLPVVNVDNVSLGVVNPTAGIAAIGSFLPSPPQNIMPSASVVSLFPGTNPVGVGAS